MKKIGLSLAILLGFYRVSAAYDTSFIEQHIRKALNLDTRTQILVSTSASPSGFGSLQVVPVTVNGAPFQIFLTKDEKKYIWGYPLDLTIDPDKMRADALSLKNVHSQGSPTAPVTIVEFSDLQCSFCKKAHDILQEELYKTYSTDTVRLIFKHYPLMGHDWAETAALATECAADQGEANFWKSSDFFFANAVNISTSNIKAITMDYVKASGMDKKKFSQCFDSGRLTSRVQADRKEGMNIGVNSTPSLFINGRMVRGFRGFEDISIVIDEKLNEAKSKKK